MSFVCVHAKNKTLKAHLGATKLHHLCKKRQNRAKKGKNNTFIMDVEHRQKNTLWKKRAKKTPHVDKIQRKKKKKSVGKNTLCGIQFSACSSCRET